MESLGRAAARQARWWLAAWGTVVLGSLVLATGIAGPGLFARLSSDPPEVPGESQDGLRLLEDTSPTGTSLTLILDRVDPASAAVESAVAAGRARLLALPGVSVVRDPFQPPGGLADPVSAPLVATDGRALLVIVETDPETRSPMPQLAAIRAELESVATAVPGARGAVGGVDPLVEEIIDQVEVDLRTGEGIALPVSLLVLVIVFGGFLAAGMPIIGALASIAGALATLLGFSYVIKLDASVVNVVTVLGLGLCIDYGLLIVSRFRDEVRRLDPADRETRSGREQALAHTLATAGRTVAFSGVTVAISLAGLLFFTSDILRAVGAAGVSVVAVAMLVALTLVPALLAVGGGRIIRPGLTRRVPLLRRVAARLGDTAPSEGFFSRLARAVQRRPVLVVAGVLAVLALASWPAASIRIVSSGSELLPPGAQGRAFFETLTQRFPAAAPPSVTVVARTDAATADAWAAGLRSEPGVLGIAPAREQGEGVSVVDVRVAGGDSGQPARDLVQRIRAESPGFEMLVTGQTAGLVDFLRDLRTRAPYAAAVVVLATLVLLFLMTGSLLVPVKALVMNVVSLGASFGVLVWVFQDGHLEGLLGFDSVGGIETPIAPLVLAFGFGLAMDYEMFLLSRVKEQRDLGVANNDAVVRGLQSSGRIITSAALVIAIVFLGFAAGELLIIKQTGVALATAIAVDATLVRMLLVPATMSLLGEWNWWAPPPLRRLYSRLGLSESPRA